MTASEVERWALAVVDRLIRLGQREDDRVEFKREPPDAIKFARTLAGHANAARGEHILWLLGVDRDAGFVGIETLEWSELWPQIQSHFENRVSPTPIVVGIEWEGRGGYAIAFDTSQPPYVVKNPVFGQANGGPCEREVPWRVGTLTQTATRTHLLLLTNYLNFGTDGWLKASAAPFIDNSNGPNRTYQIFVTNNSSKPVGQCKAVLRQIDRDGTKVWGGQDAALTFQPAERSDTVNKMLWTNRPQALDVLRFELAQREVFAEPEEISAWDQNYVVGRLTPATLNGEWIFQERLEDIFSLRTDYLLTIDIGSGERGPVYELKLKFRLAGKSSDLEVVSQRELT
jgi:hypothetical protein